jgi:hypothetical protein
MSGDQHEGAVAKAARMAKELSQCAKDQAVSTAQKVYPVVKEQVHRAYETSMKAAHASYHAASDCTKSAYEALPPAEKIMVHGQELIRTAKSQVQPLIESGGALMRRASVHMQGAGGRLSEQMMVYQNQLKRWVSSIAWDKLLQNENVRVGIASIAGVTASGVLIILLRRYMRPAIPTLIEEASSEVHQSDDILYHRTVLTALDTQAKSAHGVAALSKAGIRPGDCVCESLLPSLFTVGNASMDLYQAWHMAPAKKNSWL